MTRIINLIVYILLLILIFILINNISPSKSGSFKRYDSIDKVKRALEINNLYIPHYFPSNIVWPPAKIYAQINPFKCIVTEFINKEGTVVLEIIQSYNKDFEYNSNIKINNILEESTIEINGNSAKIYSGFCKEREYCSKIDILINDTKLTFIGRFQIQELLRITKSIFRK
ncbi:MAG: hypothetical protein SVN78_03650 [Deferribacterota bacterium]|nr:hypothetical protein [Deferribacterota bacterium]